MAFGKIKTEHSGAKNGGGHWGARADAKIISKKLRRKKSKKIIKEEIVEQIKRLETAKNHKVD